MTSFLARALAAFSLLQIYAATGQEAAHFREAPTTITNLSQFWQLFMLGGETVHPLKIHVGINYYDPEWGVLWVVLGDSGSYLGGGKSPLPISSGRLVEFDGFARPGKQEILWSRTGIKDLGALTNQPVQVGATIEDPAALNLRLVALTGLIASQTEVDQNHLRLQFCSEEWHVTVYLHLKAGDPLPRLTGAFARITGVFSDKLDPGTGKQTVELWVDGASGIKVVSWLDQDARFGRPATPVEDLLAAPTDSLIRVEGEVRGWEPGASVTLRDGTGQVEVRTHQSAALGVGARVEAVGYAGREGGQAVLSRSFFRVLPGGVVAPSVSTNQGLPVLRLTEQVHALSPAEAGRGYPARIRGVVTWSEPEAREFFAQDASGGVKITLPDDGSISCPPVATMVVVSGITRAGVFAPVVAGVKLAEEGTQTLPAPVPVSLEQALAGAQHARWSEITGCVRSFDAQASPARMEVSTPAGDFEVRVPFHRSLRELPGAVIQFRGVCDARTNERRQMIALRFLTPSREYITILEAAPRDPFAAPREPMGDLLRFGSVEQQNRRVQVKGIVTAQRVGNWVQLQDGEDVVRVLARQTDRLQPGDEVEAVGLPAHQRRRLVLREAVYRRVGAGRELMPRPIQPGPFLNPRHADRLAQVEGTLLEAMCDEDGWRLHLQGDRGSLEARLVGGDPRFCKALLPGSKLRLTGIYRLGYDDNQQPRSAGLDLRSERDVQVLRFPSWWTPRRLLAGLAGIAVASILAVAWGIMLRRRVAHQTREIGNRLEQLRASEERLRVVTDCLGEGVVLTDLEGLITEVNPQLLRMSGHRREDLIGRPPLGLLGPPATHPAASSGRVMGGQEGELRRKDGTKYWAWITHAPLLGPSGAVFGTVTAVMDITERKHAEAVLRASLSTKETLLREVHHRVKNNLQIISSLLHFHAKKAPSAAAAAVFVEGRDRLRSMLLVHERLYRSANMARIDFGDYVSTLVNELLDSAAPEARHVTFAIECAPVELPAELAMPAGMIIVELVTNILKHAYAPGEPGLARLEVANKDGQVCITVTDQGAGLPAGFAPGTSTTFGWRLIHNLATQIRARVTVETSPGTTAIVSFPDHPQSRPLAA